MLSIVSQRNAWAMVPVSKLLFLCLLVLVPGFAADRPKVDQERMKPGSNSVERYQYEYSVKFVCGKPEYPAVAEGKYFTAINVHNPSDQGVMLRKKIAVALPKEKPGPVSIFFDSSLGSDQALEIDCPDIFEHASEVARGEFLKGFVVIQSELELDVVAVYTTADWQVESMHTERVPHRFVGMPKIVTPEGSSYCPPGIQGESVGKEGCCCNKPKVAAPRGPGDWWPDCELGLTCVGNLGGPTLNPGTLAICVRRVAPGVNPELHWSQPAFCGQRQP